MPNLKFEWNPKKAASNAIKHQITFDEAQSVFLDEYALVIPDPENSAVEDRFVILGLSAENRALVVVHFFREAKSVIRIISARKAGTKEQNHYWRNKP
ncbi:MAG: BrnT family toxin [Pedosphaera sp.]|nr:BrnT family toxin [Pedosphaera sp.]